MTTENDIPTKAQEPPASAEKRRPVPQHQHSQAAQWRAFLVQQQEAQKDGNAR